MIVTRNRVSWASSLSLPRPFDLTQEDFRCPLFVRYFYYSAFSFFSNVGAGESLAQAPDSKADEKRTLDVLFIGNSYTARHNLADVVKSMAEAGNPGLTLNPTTVIYGGRTLSDHWRLGTQSFVKLHSLTHADEEATVASLAKLAKDPKEPYAAAALKRHRTLSE